MLSRGQFQADVHALLTGALPPPDVAPPPPDPAVPTPEEKAALAAAARRAATKPKRHASLPRGRGPRGDHVPISSEEARFNFAPMPSQFDAADMEPAAHEYPPTREMAFLSPPSGREAREGREGREGRRAGIFSRDDRPPLERASTAAVGGHRTWQQTGRHS